MNTIRFFMEESAAANINRGLEMKITDAGTAASRQMDATLGIVVDNTLLNAPDTLPKRHLGKRFSIDHTYFSRWRAEFELPEGKAARAGDYLAM